MTSSVSNSSRIRELISNALTDQTNDREMFMKGIDYSYYYEDADYTVQTPGGETR